MEGIYLDYNATTPVLPEVLDEMIPYFTSKFSNPSAIYTSSQSVRVEMESAREVVADYLNADFEEIVFTSSGTESNNMAIKAFLSSYETGLIACSTIEHNSVLNCVRSLKNKFKVKFIQVDGNCRIDIASLEAILKEKPLIVSIMYVNNETGTIQDIKRIAEIVHSYGSVIHVDAVQAAGKIAIDVKDLDIDLLSISAHKFYGPKGAGALFIKKGLNIDKWLHGGKQEKELRASTENTPAIIGLAKACQLAKRDMESDNKTNKEMIDFLKKEIDNNLDDYIINGDEGNRISNTLSVSFSGVESNELLMALDIEGVSLSASSACGAGLSESSHVLLACKTDVKYIFGTLRFSIGKWTTKEEIEETIKKLRKIIANQRGL